MGQLIATLLFTLSAMLASAVAGTGWRRRRSAPAVGAVSVIAASTAAWSLTAVAGYLADDPSVATLTAGVSLAGISVTTAGFLCLALAVADRFWRLSRRTALLLAAEPLLLVAALLTNPWHGLVISSIAPRDSDWLLIDFGPLFWAHGLYSYVLLVAAGMLLIRPWLSGPRSQHRLYGFVLVSLLPSFLGGGATLLGYSGAVDAAPLLALAPLGFGATAFLHYWALTRLSLFELVPVTRTRLFDMIGDMVMTIDGTGRVLDLNPAAERLARRLTPDLPGRPVGLPLADVFGVSLGGCLADGVETDKTVTDVHGRAIDLNIHVSALRDSRQTTIGWAFVA
ncbi:histidine kinase N-terminal 7TM domain-containing protein, partial [Planomonospora alba]|uniref:histidine kinase N-terminal 7TM domain-containing protein n=1 Tax=Planomonospora alba TaxID=161354 RepID=UPI0031EC1452